MVKEVLFELIKNMSKAEKGYFKKYSVLSGSGQKIYLELYQALDKLSQYNERVFLNTNSTAKWTTHFSANKLYLKNLILDTLSSFHMAKNENAKLYNKWNHYNILKEKGLSKEGVKILKKLKQKAYVLEDFGLLIKVILQEKNIILQFKEKNARSSLHQLDDELEHILGLLKNESRMISLYYECFAISYSTYGQDKSSKRELNKLYKEVAESSIGPSTQSTLYQRSLCGFLENYYIFFNQRQKAFVQLQRLGAIYDKYSHLKKTNSSAYQSFLTNYIKSAIRTYRFKDAKMALDKQNESIIKDKLSAFFIQERYVHFYLLYFKNQGQFKQAVAFVQENKSRFSFLATDELNPFSIFVQLDLCMIYFGQGLFQQSLHHCNILLNDYRNSILSDFLLEIRLIGLLIHYELNDDDFILHKTNAFLKKYTLEETTRQFERIFVSYLKQLITTPTKRLKKTIYTNMLDELDALSKDAIEQFIMERMKLMEWVSSKINQTTFSEEIKKKLTDLNQS